MEHEHATRATAVADPVPIHTLAYRTAKRRAAALGCNRAALASVPRRRRYTSIQVAAAEALRRRPHVCTRPPASDSDSTPHRHSGPAPSSHERCALRLQRGRPNHDCLLEPTGPSAVQRASAGGRRARGCQFRSCARATADHSHGFGHAPCAERPAERRRASKHGGHGSRGPACVTTTRGARRMGARNRRAARAPVPAVHSTP